MTADAPRATRLREVPLAAMMVALTTATLWSLGQGLVFVEAGEPIGADIRDPVAAVPAAVMPTDVAT
jgi:hypothetical protein